MAKYTRGLSGPFLGKVGAIVGSRWRGIHYFRSLPKPSNKGPSQAQLSHRAKFSMVIKFLRPITEVLNLGYSDYKQGKLTGYNLAVRSVFADAVIGEYPNFSIDFPNFEISKGTLTPLVGMVLEEIEPRVFRYSWQFTSNGYSSFADDIVILLVYNETAKMFLIYDEALRGDASFELQIPGIYSGNVIHSWAFALKRNRKVTSTSQYLGKFKVS